MRLNLLTGKHKFQHKVSFTAIDIPRIFFLPQSLHQHTQIHPEYPQHHLSHSHSIGISTPILWKLEAKSVRKLVSSYVFKGLELNVLHSGLKLRIDWFWDWSSVSGRVEISACGFAGLCLRGGLELKFYYSYFLNGKEGRRWKLWIWWLWFLVLCLVVGWWGYVWWFLSTWDGWLRTDTVLFTILENSIRKQQRRPVVWMKTERRMFVSSGGMTGCDGKENLSDVTTRLA